MSPGAARFEATLRRALAESEAEEDALFSESHQLPALLRESVKHQEDITEALGVQVRQAVELLVAAFARSDVPLVVSAAEVYRGAVTVMMRLVFLLFAEESLLLPADDALYATSYSVGGLYAELEQRVADARDNEGEEEGDHSELLRRLAAARATVKHLPGKRVRRASLSETRVRRITAPLITALNQCTALPVNPAKGIGGKIRKTKPLLWTEPRAERWRKTGKRPAPVMVWTAAQCGAFLDSIENDRLYPLYHLAAYWGLRRSELAGLEWANADLKTRRLHVRQAQADDELDDTKSEDSDRIITIDQDTSAVLETWRERQLFERLEWGDAWQDSGRVFTREDGQPLRPGHISEHFAVLVRQAGLPPVRFHDLRHGAATGFAAGQPIKVVSAILGHSTSAFTMAVYAVVAEELAEAAAVAIAAFVPRRASNVPAHPEGS